MSFIEKLNKMKIKLVVIVSIVIFCLAFGGMAMAKYVDSSKVKEGISLGNKYLEEQKYEEAIIAFQKVIEIEPKNIEARVGLSKAYVNTGRNDEAEDVLKEAININPKMVEPYLELSKLYVSKNDLINCIKILTDGYKATNDESIKSMLEAIKLKITTDDINTTITLGEDYSLPKEVTVKVNNSELQFPVNWDTTNVDTTKVGISEFNGTLENTDKTFKLTLNVITITSIEDINNKIKQNDKYSLPSKVTATMTDNSKRDVEVTWDTSSIDTSKAGNYSYQGSVSGYNSKVKLTLNIESLPKDIESTVSDNGKVKSLSEAEELALDKINYLNPIKYDGDEYIVIPENDREGTVEGRNGYFVNVYVNITKQDPKRTTIHQRTFVDKNTGEIFNASNVAFGIGDKKLKELK